MSSNQSSENKLRMVRAVLLPLICYRVSGSIGHAALQFEENYLGMNEKIVIEPFNVKGR